MSVFKDRNLEDQRDPQTYAVLGAAFEVHSEMGHGFLELAYHEALKREFFLREIPHQHEVPIPIFYKQVELNCPYRADFLCYRELLLEIKACEAIAPVHRSQVINYLHATGLKRALLLNFGRPSLEFERFALSGSK